MKTLATAIFGETVVNTVISGAKSVARAIRTAVQPIVDTVSTAWNKATQMYREAQEEISRLDKTAPDYHLQVDAIYRSACARYMGGEDISAEPVSAGTMSTVDAGGMALQSDKFGKGYLPGGTYTQREILASIDAYINWYNCKRIKLSLDGLSPIEYRQRLGGTVKSYAQNRFADSG